MPCTASAVQQNQEHVMNKNKIAIKKEIDKSNRLIRIRDVIAITGISKSYIYQLCSNNQFPKSVQLIPGGTSVAWLESEILAWIDERIQERNQTNSQIAINQK